MAHLSVWMDIYNAVCKGSLTELQKLYEAGVDVTKSVLGEYPIFTALQKSEKDVVKYLINHGAALNIRDSSGQYPLHIASKRDMSDIVVHILEHGGNINVKSNNGCTPLHEALILDNKDIAKLLISKGADINVLCNAGQSPLEIVAKKGMLDVVEHMIEHRKNINDKDCWGHNLLHTAINNKQKDIASLCINKGADVNALNYSGESPLQIAVLRGMLDVVRRILEHGGNIHTKDCWGHTLLHVALIHQQKEIAWLLITKGADVNALNNKGDSPLHIVVSRGMLDEVKHILKYGAEINKKDNKNQTALMIAVNNHDLPIVRLLLRSGADVTAEDDCGYSAMHLAIMHDRNIHTDIADDGLEFSLQENQEEELPHKKAKVDYMRLAKSLIRHKAKIIAKDTDSMTAAEDGNLPSVQLLLRSDADANIKRKSTDDSLLNPLSSTIYNYIILQSYDDVVLLLVDKGADVDVKFKSSVDNSMVHIAAKYNNCNLLRALLEIGLEFEGKNKQGQTPLDLAVRHSSGDCVAVLLEWGASFERYKWGFSNVIVANEEKFRIRQLVEVHSQKLLCMVMVKSDEPLWEDCDPFQESCLKELEHMKQIKCGVYSLYNILLRGCSLNVTTNVALEQQILEVKESLPLYYPMLLAAFRKAKLRLKLMNYVTDCFNVYVLPAEVKMNIFSYLSNKDLKNLAPHLN